MLKGIPVSIMEAMSYGKPVISTKHAGIPELVKDVLVDENNVEELAKAISELVDNQESRIYQGKENRKIICEFSKKNLMKLEDIMWR